MDKLILDDGEGLDQGMDVTFAESVIYFNCYDEWCGSTETGFGAEINVELTKDQVKRLYDKLGEWLIKTQKQKEN